MSDWERVDRPVDSVCPIERVLFAFGPLIVSSRLKYLTSLWTAEEGLVEIVLVKVSYTSWIAEESYGLGPALESYSDRWKRTLNRSVLDR